MQCDEESADLRNSKYRSKGGILSVTIIPGKPAPGDRESDMKVELVIKASMGVKSIMVNVVVISSDWDIGYL